MSTTIETRQPSVKKNLLLENGAQLSRAEFHRLYSQVEEDQRAELVGGVVYVPSPLRRFHGVYHVVMSMLLGIYFGKTSGTEAGDNATLLLGVDCEPQPDLYLRILPEYGGQSQTTDDDYVLGAPELIFEIALSSRSLDLHAKRADYQKYGVREYVVLIPLDQDVVWWDLANNRELSLPADRILRSLQFPGLWLSIDAILSQQHTEAMKVLEQGLASAEHQEFAKTLQNRKAASQPQDSPTDH